MTYKQYTTVMKPNLWRNFKVSVHLDKIFTKYEVSMQLVMRDHCANLDRHQQFMQVAPLFAEMFWAYNSDIPAWRVVQRCLTALESGEYPDEIVKPIRNKFINILLACGIGFSVRLVD